MNVNARIAPDASSVISEVERATSVPITNVTADQYRLYLVTYSYNSVDYKEKYTRDHEVILEVMAAKAIQVVAQGHYVVLKTPGNAGH